MEYELSILLPSIRQNLLDNFLQSISENNKNISTEVVIVGPYEVSYKKYKSLSIKNIIDFGNINRASQIALVNAKGKYILFASDDGTFINEGISHIFNTMDSMGNRDCLKIAMGRYAEGSEGEHNWMLDESYYKLNSHGDCPQSIANDSFYMGNYLLLDREFLLKEYGGFDYRFEGSALANNELAVRIQRFSKPEIKLTKKQIVKCTHMPGISGDHAPVHYSHIDHDTPLYQRLVNNMIESDKYKDSDDWKKIPEVWDRRFK